MPAVYPVLSTTQAYGGCESFHTATELHYPESFLYFNYLFTWWRTHLGSKRVIFCHKILKNTPKKIMVENCVYWFKKRRKRERVNKKVCNKHIKRELNQQTNSDWQKEKGNKVKEDKKWEETKEKCSNHKLWSRVWCSHCGAEETNMCWAAWLNTQDQCHI